MTRKIPKSIVTLDGISLEDFPAKVAKYSEELRAWLIAMSFMILEDQSPPRMPERSEYPDPSTYREALARYDVEVAHLTQPYLPPDVPAVVLIALDWMTFLPDFELVDDDPWSQKSEGGL